VRQVGHLAELHRDAPSTKHKFYLPTTHFGNWLLIIRNFGSPAGRIIMVHIPYSLHTHTHTRARAHTHTHTHIHAHTHVYTPVCVSYICPGGSLAHMPTR
jgi:hypothetical protein